MPCWKASCGRKIPLSHLFLRSGRAGLGKCTAFFCENQFCHIVVTIKIPWVYEWNFFGGKVSCAYAPNR
jgi:hypothetical protein